MLIKRFPAIFTKFIDVPPMPFFLSSQKCEVPDDVEIPVEKEAFMDEFFSQVTLSEG